MKKDLTIDEFLVPSKTLQHEIKVKGSRFIASIERIHSAEEAEEIVERYRKRYHDATHNCFAFRLDDTVFRYSDDGEPSGTAGKPILQVIDSRELKQILIIVTRYFGGTKLGTGGLIRAYSEAASNAQARLQVKIVVRTVLLTLQLKYEQEPFVRKFLDRFGGRIADSRYSDAIELDILLPESRQKGFMDELKEATHSTVKILAS